jgi:hypothetical protein
MARKTVRVSDQSGTEIEDGTGAVVRINFTDGRRPSREADLTTPWRRPEALPPSPATVFWPL